MAVVDLRLRTFNVLPALVVAVPVAFLCGLIGISAARAGPASRSTAASTASARAPSASRALLVWGGLYVSLVERTRARLLRRCSARRRRRSDGAVRSLPPCSRSGTACARRGRAGRSTSTGRAGDQDPRQVPARARGRAVRQLPSPTYVKGFLRTYAEYLGLDGQLYVDEFNSRFVAGVDHHDAGPRRSSVRPERRTRRLEAGIVLLVVAVVALVTLVVAAAWQSSGGSKTPPPAAPRHDDAQAHAAACGAVPGRSRRCRDRPTSPSTATSATGQAPLPGDDRARAHGAVQRQVLLGQRQLAREPPHRRARQAGPAHRRQAGHAHGDAERGADRLSNLARVDRRHGLGARPRRPQRSQRPVSGAVPARAGRRACRGADRGRQAGRARDGAPRGAAPRPARRLRRAGADARRPHGRAAGARGRAATSGRRGDRGADRGALALDRRAPEAALRRLRSRRAQAGHRPGGRRDRRARRHRAGARAGARRRTRRGDAPGAAA